MTQPILHPRQTVFTRTQMTAGSDSCSNWSSSSASQIPPTFTLAFCICNVDLAQNRYFEDEAFIGYLKHLQYWQRPEYTRFIMYPHCLFFLEQLQNANFRAAMAHPGNKELAHRQQFYFWKNYRNNRLKHILPRSLPEPVPALPPPAPPQHAVPPVPPVPATTVSVTATAPAPSPMQYAMPPGSAPKVEPRNSGVDRRKRKKDG
ncbi:mediator of RNA polymerase II transcription subunit 31-like isoform X3 [Malus domestica]|uniref:mediator of RNA polymerase II transcription subunit 31-like isoform X3 n=1 Tax=Malus domestica TaxID=3750 RepID=UPI0010AB3DFA|nr:mediator of RNA polymerase II transcription subunit 31-like isoform X3 [Malus domestica]XP_028958604.1 mediator of RNA polymerase II transcription subunit 31-like isoform X3 [Malus domestica]